MYSKIFLFFSSEVSYHTSQGANEVVLFILLPPPPSRKICYWTTFLRVLCQLWDLCRWGGAGSISRGPTDSDSCRPCASFASKVAFDVIYD